MATKIDFEKFEFKLLTNEYMESALNVVRLAFLKDETICIATEVNLNPKAGEELIKLCVGAAEDGVSFVAIDKTTNEVVSVAFNKIQTLPIDTNVESDFESFAKNCKEDSSKALMNFMIDVDSKYDIFHEYRIDSLVEVMFIGTLSQYRRQGLSYHLLALTKDLTQGLFTNQRRRISPKGTEIQVECHPKALSTIATCPATYFMAKKLGFETLLTVSLDEWSFKGKTFAERPGSKTDIHLMCCKL